MYQYFMYSIRRYSQFKMKDQHFIKILIFEYRRINEINKFGFFFFVNMQHVNQLSNGSTKPVVVDVSWV